MRIADLCSGAGGAAWGLHQAFPDAEIVGVDIRPQPRYPFEFVLGDALEFDLTGFDFVWASPPCQHYIRSGLVDRSSTRDLIPAMRAHLSAAGMPWIMENVPGAPLAAGVLLCGSMFGLAIRRHRLFEANWALPLAPASCQHHLPITGVYGYGHGHGKRGANVLKGARKMLAGTTEVWRREMGIDWMQQSELAQAIPPAYSRYLAQFIPTTERLAP